MPQLTWLITGCSSGFGEQLAHGALARGDRVVATARGDLGRLSALKNAGAVVYELDVTAPLDKIKETVAAIITEVGGLDVLVNNAGYVDSATLEEVSRDMYLDQFETNLFGVVSVTQAVLPHFRQKRAGRIAFMGSACSWVGEPGVGPYAWSKFALQGLCESLKHEVSQFNIQPIMFDLGHSRTNVMRNARERPEIELIEEYDDLRDMRDQVFDAVDGNQPNDPKKIAEIMIDVLKGEGVAAGKPFPDRLPLGADVLRTIRRKCNVTLALCKEWEDVITSTDADD